LVETIRSLREKEQTRIPIGSLPPLQVHCLLKGLVG